MASAVPKPCGIIEKILLGIYFFPAMPLASLFLFVLIAAVFVETERFGPWILWGFVPGFIVNLICTSRWISRAYLDRNRHLTGTYVFYAVVGTGMCMGVPLVPLLMAIPAGLYIGRKMLLRNESREGSIGAFHRMARFSAFVMGGVCGLVVFWGGIGGMIGSRFECGPFSFTYTVPIYLMISLMCTAILMAGTYGLSFAASRFLYKAIGKSDKGSSTG